MAGAITEYDPSDFVTELHSEGALPQNAGGDPAVPDGAFPDTHVYPAVEAPAGLISA